jgi:hypothetical protein
MMAPPWLMLLIFAALAGALLAVYRAAGVTRPRDPVPAVGMMSAVLGFVVAGIGYIRHGYLSFGLGSRWAWALAAFQLALMLVVYGRAAYVAHRTVAVLREHPFLAEEDKRFLLARPRAWLRAWLVMLLWAVLISVFGLWGVKNMRSAVVDLAWGLLYAVLWGLAVAVWAGLLRRQRRA